jgi:hypothetical protein
MIVAALVAALVAVAAGSGAAKVGVLKPTVSITFTPVVTVKGKRFKKLETVTVKLKDPDHTWTRKVRANKLGTFSVGFGALALNDCSEYTLTAVGSLKSRYSFSHSLVPC